MGQDVDLTIGTSAGSIVGSYVSARTDAAGIKEIDRAAMAARNVPVAQYISLAEPVAGRRHLAEPETPHHRRGLLHWSSCRPTVASTLPPHVRPVPHCPGHRPGLAG